MGVEQLVDVHGDRVRFTLDRAFALVAHQLLGLVGDSTAHGESRATRGDFDDFHQGDAAWKIAVEVDRKAVALIVDQRAPHPSRALPPLRRVEHEVGCFCLQNA